MLVHEKITEEQFLAQIKHAPLIMKALKQANQSHKNHSRSNKQPYLTEHIYPVAIMTANYYGDSVTDEVIAAALLHDVLEDDPEMNDDKFRSLFGDKVYTTVKVLTKPDGEDWRAINKKYFKQLGNGSRDAKIIKVMERIDNLYWAHTFGEKLIEQYIDETENFYLKLAQEVDSELYKEMKKLLEKLKK